MGTIFLNGIYLYLYAITVFSFAFTYYHDKRLVNGRLLYVSIPAWVEQEEEVRNLIKLLTRRYIVIIISFTILSVYFALPVPYKGWVCIVGIFSYIGLFSYVTKSARKNLLKLKKEKQWIELKANIVHHFDLSLSTESGRKITYIYFLVPLLIQGVSIGICFNQNNRLQAFSSIFFIILLILLYTFLNRMPQKTYCEDTAINKAVNDNRRYYSGRMLFLFTLADAFLSIFLSLQTILPGRVTFFLGAVCFLIIAVFLFLAIESLSKMNKLKLNYLQGVKDYQYDEDDFWRYGLFGASYNNPADPAILKANNSNGMNYNINMGNPRARMISAAFLCLLILFLSYLFVYPWFLDRKHELVEMNIDGGQLSISGPFYNKEIDIDSIEKVDLLKEIPKGIRTFGSANGIYATGNYRLDGIGNCKMYIASRHMLYILCNTSSGIVIVNDDEESKTLEIYEQLSNLAVK